MSVVTKQVPHHLPAPDKCASTWCGASEADHADIFHSFQPPAPPVNPQRVVEAEITTVWTCWSCGEQSDVWGIGVGWINCSECGEDCYLA